MKILPQKPLFLQGRIKPFSLVAEWQQRWQAADSFAFPSLDRIKAIGSTTSMDDYEKRKLGIFNQLNFFQFITGLIIPIAGAITNRHFPLIAWIVASLPAFINILVLILNARRKYDLTQVAYFVLYPFATSFVYLWGINMGVELS